MLGRSHLIVGATGFLAVGATVLEATGTPLSGAELAAGAVVCAGAAMLPDVDHPNATVAHSLGPVTHALAKIVSKLFGGHRNGTHSFLFALLVTFGLTAWLDASHGPWVYLGVTFFFTSLVVRVLTEARGAICAAVALFIAAAIITICPSHTWLPYAIGLGCLLHMLGDVVTPEGVPPLWPVSRTRISVPLVGHTGDNREKAIAAVCGLLCCYLLATVVFLPLWGHRFGPSAAQASVRSVATAPPHQASRLELPVGLARQLVSESRRLLVRIPAHLS